MGLARVDSAAAFENVASKRVMEKIGMRYVGLDEEGGHAFAIRREEYLQGAEGEVWGRGASGRGSHAERGNQDRDL